MQGKKKNGKNLNIYFGGKFNARVEQEQFSSARWNCNRDNVTLEDFEVGKVTDMLNEISDSGVAPEDFSWSIFIIQRMELGLNECQLHWTFGVINHIKLLNC